MQTIETSTINKLVNETNEQIRNLQNLLIALRPINTDIKIYEDLTNQVYKDLQELTSYKSRLLKQLLGELKTVS